MSNRNASPAENDDAEAVTWIAPKLQNGVAHTSFESNSKSTALGRASAPGLTVEALEKMARAAQEEGYTQGHEEGFSQGLSQAQNLVDRLYGIVENLRKPLEHLDQEVTTALAQLASEIAGSLLREIYLAQPAKMAALVDEALASLPSGSRDVEIRLHADDVAAVAPLITPSEVGDARRIIADRNLKPGDVRVHADTLRIDARIRSRLDAVLAGMADLPNSDTNE